MALSGDSDVVALAREIAARMSPKSLLSAEDVASMLSCTARYVTDRYAHAPGFPKALYLTGPNGGRSRPKWRRSAITAWIDAHDQVSPLKRQKQGAAKEQDRSLSNTKCITIPILRLVGDTACPQTPETRMNAAFKIPSWAP